MMKSLALVAFVVSLCVACGVAEQVDEVVGASRENQATTRPRSCPQFGSWLMLPKTPRVGLPAEIQVDVSDLDSPPEALSLEWRAGAGSFSEPSAAVTSFLCEREGYQTIALVARDETNCVRQLDLEINCFPR